MKKALLTVFSVILLGFIGVTGTFGTMYEKELKVNEPTEETQPVEEVPADKEPAETPSETEAPKTEEQPKTEESTEETKQVSYVMFVEDEVEATEPGNSEVTEPVTQPEKRVLGDVLTNKLKLTKLKDKLGVNKFKNLCVYVCAGLSFVEGILVSLFFRKSNKVKKQRKTDVGAVGQAIEGYDVQNRPNLKF